MENYTEQTLFFPQKIIMDTIMDSVWIVYSKRIK